MNMMARTAAGAVALTLSAVPLAQESQIQLTDAPGKDKVGQCGVCHSLDYIQMNSRFLDAAGWTATIKKMINAFGAPIPSADVEAIASYLAQQYGKSTPAGP